MKKCSIVLALTLMILFPVLGHTADFGNIYLRYMEGDVLVKTDDMTEWLPASPNMPLKDGDKIWSPDNGRAELFLRNGTMVRLDRNTYMEILTSEDKLARFYLAEGHAYGNTKVQQGDAVLFETPTASLRAYGQSAFRIDVTENEDTDVTVLRGEIFMDRQSGQMKINAGDRMVVRKNGPYPELVRMVPADQWEQWNRQRDYEASFSRQGNSVAYLPDELKSYSSDLERNGRWAYEQEYGYVWTPTAVVADSWSPYSVGRWVWMNGDYVWVSYESWGWAPYHYGRWVFMNHRGWSWVPPGRGSVHWGPGYVGWVHTPTHISWVPLAPKDIYYGHGNFGLHSVHIKNVTFRDVTVNKIVYKNVYVKNAVTTVQRDTFATARPARMSAKENLFLKEKRVMGAPERRPGKTALMPVIKDIPLAKLPPQKISNRAFKAIKNNNIPTTGIQSKEGPLTGLPGMKKGTQMMNDRIPDGQQRVNTATVSMEQRRSVAGNHDVKKGPAVESGKERVDRRLNELRAKNSTGPIVKEALSKEPPPVFMTSVPEKKVDITRKNPERIEIRQQARTTVEQRQIPGVVENARPISPANENNPVPKPQVQVPKKDDNIIVNSRTLPQIVKREVPPEKKREIIVAHSTGETPIQRSFDRIKPEVNGNIKPANVQHIQAAQRKPAPVEKVVPEKTMEVKRVDPKPDVQRQPAPDKISRINENHRGGAPDVPVSKLNARNEGRGAGR